MNFARVDTTYLSDGWTLEIKEAPYSYAESIVNVLTSCTLTVNKPPKVVLDAFADRRLVSVAALHGTRFVHFTGFVVSAHQRPGIGMVAEIRSRGGCHILEAIPHPAVRPIDALPAG